MDGTLTKCVAMMGTDVRAMYPKDSSKLCNIKEPVEHLPDLAGIPCQKGKTREKEMTFVVTEEDQITEQELNYAELMLYESILLALKDKGILMAEEVQACRERDLQRRKMKELNRHEEL